MKTEIGANDAHLAALNNDVATLEELKKTSAQQLTETSHFGFNLAFFCCLCRRTGSFALGAETLSSLTYGQRQ